MSAGPLTPMESHEMSTPATAMDDAPVLVERLTLNRPHALNAVNAELSAVVGATLEEAGQVKVLLENVRFFWVLS